MGRRQGSKGEPVRQSRGPGIQAGFLGRVKPGWPRTASHALTPESCVENPATVILCVCTVYMQKISKKGNLLRRWPLGELRRRRLAGGEKEKPGVQGEVFSRGFWFGSSINYSCKGNRPCQEHQVSEASPGGAFYPQKPWRGTRVSG